MKTVLTPNLLKFTFATIILTLIFRYALSISITNEIFIAVLISALLYAGFMFFNGKFFGKKDYEYLPIYDIGFRFHLATYLGHNIISILWFLFGFESKHESITSIYNTAIIWAVLLLIHFVYFLSVKKNSIKNLDKDDLFE